MGALTTRGATSILSESPAARISYFKDFAVAHPLLVEAKDRLREAIAEAAPNSLIIVSGPTGVGKTTLLLKIKQLLSAKVVQESGREQPTRLPVAIVEAIPPESRMFSWRAQFMRLLEAMNDPLVTSKRRPNSADRSAQMLRAFPNDRGATADYHYAVEQAIRYRRSYAVLIDEAQHLFATASGRQLEDQLNVVKSLANRCNTVHVLCGTYDLLRIRNLSGQLSRRSIDIHFPRYEATKSNDARTFLRVLHAFAEHVPLEEMPDLKRHWEYLYERSIGCVGILKDWLLRSLATAIGESAPILSLKHLEKHALSASQCQRLIEEASLGEVQFRDSDEVRQSLRVRLGLPECSTDEVSAHNGHQTRQQRPGQRCPKRDETGLGGCHERVQNVALRGMEPSGAAFS